MGKTKEWFIENNGFMHEQELMNLNNDAEILRQEEEYLYWKEFRERRDRELQETIDLMYKSLNQ